jgi:alpha-methylacyl-CoA racemase
MTGPLAGLRIVEFAGIGPAPFCAMMLADNGAEIIRIDRPGAERADPGVADHFWNRSRKSIAIDLKSEAGIDCARRLVASADGVIEGFRPGVMERLGLGPDVLLADNPKLTFGRMTGWGQDGPYAGMAGHDINYIAISGALHAIGRREDGPVPPLNLIGDMGGGGMLLAFGMVSALLHAQRTGQGQVVDCAMSEGAAALMVMMYSMQASGVWRDERGTNMLDGACHYYDAYETADGRHIAIGSIEPQFYNEMLSLLGLADDPAFREQNKRSAWPELKAKIAERFKTRTRDEWCAVFEGTDACFAPVMSLEEAPHHPHNRARGSFVEVKGKHQPAPVPRFLVSGAVAPSAMHSSDEVTGKILAEAGFGEDEIANLRAQGAVA